MRWKGSCRSCHHSHVTKAYHEIAPLERGDFIKLGKHYLIECLHPKYHYRFGEQILTDNFKVPEYCKEYKPMPYPDYWRR